MTRMHLRTAIFGSSRRITTGIMVAACIASTGCATNYLTNSTEGTYGVPMTERTIPQRLLDRSIEHTAKINVYGLKEDLQQTSRMGIDSFNSEVLLTGEVPTEALKVEVEKVISSMPDVRRVYNEMEVSASKGYSSTVHDGYITSKLLAKVAASDGVKASQIKAVTNNGVVYIMDEPSSGLHPNDVANSTVGVTELVLLTTVVDNTGVKINNDDIMYENNLANPTTTPVIVDTAVSTATPIVVTEDGNTVTQPSSSPYIELYKNQ